MAAKTRKYVPLETADIQRVERIDVDRFLHAVAARRAGVDAFSSEAALLHMLLVAGLDMIESEADEERYAQLAASEDDEDREFRAAMRTRRQA